MPPERLTPRIPLPDTAVDQSSKTSLEQKTETQSMTGDELRAQLLAIGIEKNAFDVDTGNHTDLLRGILAFYVKGEQRWKNVIELLKRAGYNQDPAGIDTGFPKDHQWFNTHPKDKPLKGDIYMFRILTQGRTLRTYRRLKERQALTVLTNYAILFNACFIKLLIHNNRQQ